MKSSATLTSPIIDVHVTTAQPTSAAFDWHALVPTLLTIAAAVIGYIIVEGFARRREKRADLRTLLGFFRDAVDSVVRDATDFYALAGSSSRARSLAVAIKSKIASLSDIFDALRAGGIHVAADDELRLFRQSVTSGDFDSALRQPLSQDAGRYVDIAAAAQHLERRVDLAFYKSVIEGTLSRRSNKNRSSNDVIQP